MQSKGLSRIFSSTNSKASILWHSAFSTVQLSHRCDYWKYCSFEYRDLCWQSDVSAFSNMLLLLKVTHSCLTLCDPMDCPWNSRGHNTGVGSLSLLQLIFPTQESNHGLLHCRRILDQLSQKGSPHYLIPYWNKPLLPYWTSLVAQMVKPLPTMRETWV